MFNRFKSEGWGRGMVNYGCAKGVVKVWIEDLVLLRISTVRRIF